MKKKVLISIEEDVLAKLDDISNGQGWDRSATITNLVAGGLGKNKNLIEIPQNKITKDEIAEFLGISKFDKKYVTMWDRITKYYEND